MPVKTPRKTEKIETNGFHKTSLSKEALKQAEGYSRSELLQAVGLYEKIQDIRVGAQLAKSAHERGADEQCVAFPDEEDALFGDLEDDGEPPTLAVSEIITSMGYLEGQVKRAIGKYVKAHPIGRWLLSLRGVAEVVAGSLLAYVDFKRCCCEPYRYWRGGKRDEIPEHDCPGLVTAGHIWSYAGIRPREWKKGSIRPFNNRLKTVLLGHMGMQLRTNSATSESTERDPEEMAASIITEREKAKKPVTRERALEMALNRLKRNGSLIDSLEHDPSFLYCRVYREAKAHIHALNERGVYQIEATRMLKEYEAHLKQSKASEKTWEKWLKSPQRDFWASGKRAPIGVDRMAARKAITLFLSHFHHVGYEVTFGHRPPSKPYCLTEWAGANQHSHYIPPPNWPMI